MPTIAYTDYADYADYTDTDRHRPTQTARRTTRSRSRSHTYCLLVYFFMRVTEL